MVRPGEPSLALAPMDGITDARMRRLQGQIGAFSYAVSEFVRVSAQALPPKVIRRAVPEVQNGGRTSSGLPVQVQLLGGDPDRVAETALAAVRAGARAIDLNFGCPAPTVNRNDGGATLLKCPERVRGLVAAVRAAVPPWISVSAKLRLGWAETDEIDRNAAMAEEGGADWLTLHARTRIQGYAPPVFWPKVGEIVRRARVPVVVNGDIWTVEDFRRCQEESGSVHFMIGRPALANPRLSHHISRKLGLTQADAPNQSWRERFAQLIGPTETEGALPDGRALARIKQWAAIAHRHGSFPEWPTLKHATSLDQIWDALPREAEEMAYAN